MKYRMKSSIKSFIRENKKTMIIIAILTFLLIADIIYTFFIRISEKKVELLSYTVQSQDEFMKSRADVSSDITGLSQYDKFIKGLDYHDGSDTDGDGLTDKEEIEVYGTDPLKKSTAGDLYTDGYKVSNDMDTSKYYDTLNVVFPGNECPEISFLNVNIQNMGAMSERNTFHAHTLSDYGVNKIYKEYFVHEYTGKISIDVTDTLRENNLQLSDISIYVIKGTFSVAGLSELNECKYTADDNVLTLKYDFTAGTSYYLYIAEKKTLLNKIFAASSKSQNSQDTEVNFFAETSPILQLFKMTKLKIYYPEQGTEEANNAMKEMAYNYYSSFSPVTDKDEVEFIASSSNEINRMYQMKHTILSMFEAKDIEDYTLTRKNLKYMLYFYCFNTTERVYAADGTSGSNGASDTVEKYKNYHTTFDPYVDELPFQNFKSKYGTTGNCAAITYLTSNLFNKGTFPTSGSYAGIEWDLSVDSENDTLTDKGLYDFKTRTFVDDKAVNGNDYLSEENLTPGENEFVKMMGAYFLESQEKLPYLNEYMINNSTQSLSWSVAETMIERLNQGEIINIGLYLKDGTGHEITAYDYYYVSENEVTFRIYDSNLPQNIKLGIEVNNGGACYLKCQKIKKADGSFSMSYLYYPVKGNFGYMASSDADLMSMSSFILSDDDWNVLN